MRRRRFSTRLRRVLGVPALFSAGYGNVGSSIYYALGVVALVALSIADKSAIDRATKRKIESMIEIIHSIRNARTKTKIKPTKFIKTLLSLQDAEFPLENYTPAIATLARVRPLTITPDLIRGKEDKAAREEPAKVLVLRDVEVVLPLSGMVDREAESKRLRKEIEVSQAQIVRTEAKLQNEQFLSKAPAQVIEAERRKLAEYKDRLERLEKQLGELG